MVELGLIGYPLGHSFSAKYFAEKFAREGIEGSYTLFPIEQLGKFPELLNSHKSLRGLNVTIPYKESVLSLLDSFSAEAKEIGAVNVIKISETCDGNRVLEGHNTDWIGFRNSLLPYMRPDVTSALVLGTGGASKAVGYALDKMGVETTFVTRNLSKFPDRADIVSYEQLTQGLIEENLLIVNTTPVGMYPKTAVCPDIPYEFITSHHIAFDLIYNPLETLFMRKAAAKGATVVNGLSMLYSQAEEAWKIWS